jgi:predicted dehydrogenase
MNSKFMLERLLIVGLGSIGARHARLVRKLIPKIQIAVFRHQSSQPPPDIEVDHCFTSIDEVRRFEPQAAVISNPASHHLDIALSLARQSVHLLVEKPISSQATNKVLELISICKEQGITLMTGYNLRFLPSLNAFRDLLLQDKVGKIFSIRAEVGQYLPDWRPGSDYRQTVSAQKKLGGGVLLELSHEIDYLQWIFGRIDWVKAHVACHSDLEIDVEDTAYLLLGFESDEYGQQRVASLNMDFIRHDTTRQCVVVGDKGTLRWNGVDGKVDFISSSVDKWEELFSEQLERDLTYTEEIIHFVSCVEKGKIPSVTGEDGLAALVVVDAARKSSEEGRIIFPEGIIES